MEWLPPWQPLEASEAEQRMAAAWQREAQAEIAPSHVLYGMTLRLIGCRQDRDDALFLLPDGRVAVVHLTWTQAPEPAPQYPETNVFPSLQGWGRTAMRKDHQLWSGE